MTAAASCSPTPEGRLHLRTPLLFVGVLLAACSGSEEGRTAVAAEPSHRVEVERPAAETTHPVVQQVAGEELNDQIADSRRTAIVQAASRVAPGVATLAVVRSQQLPSGFFDLFAPRTRRTAGYGSGFVIDGDAGVLLTNEHVVRGAERVQVTLPDGRDFEAEVVGTDPVTDVAVLRVESTSPLPEVPLGSSEGLLIGEWVVAIGNPFGNLIANADPSVTTGVVSATNRHIIPREDAEIFYTGMIQTDASINPGNSGGPLVNALGEVIGMNSSIFSRSGGSEGLGFAIPINRVLRVAGDLLEHGEVRRAWLGLEVEAAEADIWGRTRGVVIQRVAGRSPAGRGGLIAGRRILAVNGEPLFAPLDWQNVTLDLREGERITLEVEEQPEPVVLTAAAPPSTQAERVVILEGVEGITVTPEIASELGLRSDRGALLTSVSSAVRSALGLLPGDLLLGIQVGATGRAVNRAEDAAELLAALPRTGSYQLRLELERDGRVQTFNLIRR